MKTIYKVLKDNNEGVESICKGHYTAAKKAFRAALVGLKECEDQEQENEVNLKTPCHQISRPLILETCSIKSFDRIGCNYDSDSEHYIFRNALMVSADPKRTDYESLYPILGPGLTAIVVFNLSLANHYNEYRRNRGSANLRKVVKTYSRAWEALHNDPSLLKQYPVFRETMVLAMLNNMGILFHKLAEYQKAKRCFKALRNAFQSKTTGVQALRQDAHYGMAINGMAMNALFIDQPRTASAA